MSITHAKVSAKSDGGDPSLVLPSDWNDDHEVDNITMPEAAAPGTPASGKVILYAKSDGRIYSKDDGGTEYGPFDAAGGGGPLLYIDSLSLHADGDEMASMSGWTSGGTASSSAVTSEQYDATCYDLVFGAQGGRFYRSISSDFLAETHSYYVTIHEVNNSGNDPSGASGGMLAIQLVDNSGNGVGASLYNNNHSIYAWGISGNNYNASGTEAMNGSAQFVLNNKIPQVWKVTKSSTTYAFAFSMDGGITYPYSTSRTSSTTFTRFQIGRLYTNGGTNPFLRVGRVNLA